MRGSWCSQGKSTNPDVQAEWKERGVLVWLRKIWLILGYLCKGRRNCQKCGKIKQKARQVVSSLTV